MAVFRGFHLIAGGAERAVGCQEWPGKLTGLGQERLESDATAQRASEKPLNGGKAGFKRPLRRADGLDRCGRARD